MNLVEEGVDLAVRIGHLPDSNLIAKRIGEVHRMLVASPDYLAECGVPALPADLRLHSMISFTGLMANREWRFLNGQKTGSVTLHPAFEINDAVAAVKAAELGHGITIALSYMVSEQIRDDKLVPVLPAFTPPPQPVHLVYPHAQLVAPKVRAFIDFAAPRLKTALDQLAWIETDDTASTGSS